MTTSSTGDGPVPGTDTARPIPNSSDVGAIPPKGTRKRLEHIDAMRPVKQAAVISTHTLVYFAPLATSITVAGLIMLTRFSRDAFLFVSACMLAFSYRNTLKMDLATYTRKRFMSVGLPYLAWTLIYYFFTAATPITHFPYYTYQGWHAFSLDGMHHLFTLTWTGYYHLYFLILIMEFYVLFPALLAFIRRHPRWHWQILWASLLWQLLWGVLIAERLFGLHISGFWQTRLVFSYPVYLIGGVIIALHLDEVHRHIVHRAHWIIAGTLAFAGIDEALNYLGRCAWLPAWMHTGPAVFSPLVVPFNIGAILCVYLLGVFLVSEHRSLRTRAMVQSGSDNSYGVYLSQMLWIPILLRGRDHFHVDIPWWIAAPLALVLVYLIGFVFTALMARTPLARAVTGRSRVTWISLAPRRSFSEASLRGDVGDGPLEVVTD